MNELDTTRVNKIIAHVTGVSRREVDDAISAGRVTVNGKPVRLGAQVSASDIIVFDGAVLPVQQPYTYLLLHKPVGYVCSRKQQGEYKTIYSLLPSRWQKLKAVGRLDRESSGVILLTDDGDSAHRMTHPSFKKRKVYEVTLDHNLAPLHQQMINDHGVRLEDGVSQLQLERLSDEDRLTWKVTMHEGRNRQIRRTFTALSYEVVKLHRTDFGPFRLNELPKGSCLPVTVDGTTVE